MPTETKTNTEHAFVPRENTLTGVFAASVKARLAVAGLVGDGIPKGDIDLITGADHAAPDMTTPGIKEDTHGVEEALDEVLHVVTETFSDDDKVFVAFDRVLADGGALLSLSMAGRENMRAELAVSLRSQGAGSVYYWGALATERL